MVRAVGELHAKFGWRWPCQPKLALPPPAGVAAVFLWFLGCPLHLSRLECCCVGWFDFCLVFGTKFSLLSVVLTKAVQNSPCVGKTCRIGPFRVCVESFVPDMR